MKSEIISASPLTELTAISPLDGRYRKKIESLAPFASEMALIQTRVEIEARYLVALSDVGVVRPLVDQERETLLNLGPSLTLEQAGRVKEIEDTTQHDVKAMERAFREFVAGTSLEDITEMIHFGLTSEDVNNLAYRLLLKRGITEIYVPALNELINNLVEKAGNYKDIPMLGRTHGQAAVPTTLGKEMANMAIRLNRQTRKLEKMQLTGKVNGAIGNYNALSLAVREIDWIEFSQYFVTSLGLEPNLFTTQINPYEDMIEIFQTLQRINGVIIDIDQDMWRYISDYWFAMEAKAGEVGSSVMPQKINPIHFENSEGNAHLANSLWEGMSRKLSVSRLQRDLSDSTTVRNIGVGLGYGLLASLNTLTGLRRVHPNLARIEESLNDNWSTLTEGVQTVLRKAGVKDPYSMVASLVRGQKIGPEEWQSWIEGLAIAEEVKEILKNITPTTYIGYAQRLTEMALKEIKESRK